MSIADKHVVKNQYVNSDRLETRISIHEKYSRNKQPFGEWIVSHYNLLPGEKVLEIGCGTGSMWEQYEDFYNDDELVLCLSKKLK